MCTNKCCFYFYFNFNVLIWLLLTFVVPMQTQTDTHALISHLSVSNASIFIETINHRLNRVVDFATLVAAAPASSTPPAKKEVSGGGDQSCLSSYWCHHWHQIWRRFASDLDCSSSSEGVVRTENHCYGCYWRRFFHGNAVPFRPSREVSFATIDASLKFFKR